jgi:hypothetical protein
MSTYNLRPRTQAQIHPYTNANSIVTEEDLMTDSESDNEYEPSDCEEDSDTEEDPNTGTEEDPNTGTEEDTNTFATSSILEQSITNTTGSVESVAQITE